MSVDILLHNEAYEEYIDAYFWYEKENKDLGKRFMNAVDNKIQQIKVNPECYSKTIRNYRQVKVVDFPYVIAYCYFPKRKLVFISSIYHNSRNPKYKHRKVH